VRSERVARRKDVPNMSRDRRDIPRVSGPLNPPSVVTFSAALHQDELTANWNRARNGEGLQ
jgi:hypothetical protein